MGVKLKSGISVAVLAFVVLLLAAILVSGCAKKGESEQQQAAQGAELGTVPLTELTEKQAEEAGIVVQPKNAPWKIVVIKKEGFIPNTLTIKAGMMVLFTNKDTGDHWPASAVHPTHTAYPGTDAKKCGTAEAEQMFDKCGNIEPEKMWAFMFDHVGTWKYHDHLNPDSKGTIIVEPAKEK